MIFWIVDKKTDSKVKHTPCQPLPTIWLLRLSSTFRYDRVPPKHCVSEGDHFHCCAAHPWESPSVPRSLKTGVLNWKNWPSSKEFSCSTTFVILTNATFTSAGVFLDFWCSKKFVLNSLMLLSMNSYWDARVRISENRQINPIIRPSTFLNRGIQLAFGLYRINFEVLSSFFELLKEFFLSFSPIRGSSLLNRT